MGVENYFHKVLVSGIDVTSYVQEFRFTDSLLERVDYVVITFNIGALTDAGVSWNPGSEITIQRGTSDSNLIYVFRGYVTEYTPEGLSMSVRAQNKLWLLKQRQVTKSFDKNIDSEAGKLSEIIKTLVTQFGGLNADSNTIQDSGTALTLNKYLCVNDEVFERVMKLVDALGWQLYYNPEDDKVYCEEFGFRTYSGTVKYYDATSSVTIVSVPILNYNYNNIINKVTVNGAKQLDTKTETFSGDDSTTAFTLSFTPQTTKVDISGTLQTRGVRSGDNTAFDYYVEEDTKKVVFTTAPTTGTNNITVEYTSMVPVPVVLRDDDSIAEYSPVNDTTGERTPFHKTITFTDIIDVDDAINRGNEYLRIYSTPFVTYEYQVLQSEPIFYPGYKVAVQDLVNGFTGELVVSEVIRQYPYFTDVIRLSDQRNYIEQDTDIKTRVEKLEKEQLRNVGTLFSVFDQSPREIDIQRRYFKRQTRTFNGDGFIVGKHAVVGNNSVGADTSTRVTQNIIPGNFQFDEYFYDTEFVDTTNSTASVDTANWRVADTGGGGGFFLPTILQSEAIYGNQLTINSFSVTIRYTGGNLRFYYGVSSTAETSPTSWTEVTGIANGVPKGVTVSSGNKFLYYRIVKDYDTIIQGTQNSFGRFTAPAIRVENILES